ENAGMSPKCHPLTTYPPFPNLLNVTFPSFRLEESAGKNYQKLTLFVYNFGKLSISYFFSVTCGFFFPEEPCPPIPKITLLSLYRGETPRRVRSELLFVSP